MAELGGITELQMLQAEMELLENQLSGIQQAENTSTACARIIASIKDNEGKDGFLVHEGGTMHTDHNMYYAAAATNGDGGCCVII
jgi:prefoldin subunit 5